MHLGNEEALDLIKLLLRAQPDSRQVDLPSTYESGVKGHAPVNINRRPLQII
jgi:hypothetical protein